MKSNIRFKIYTLGYNIFIWDTELEIMMDTVMYNIYIYYIL